MPRKKLAHFTPQLKEIIKKLQSEDILKSRELETLLEHVIITSNNFDSENEIDYKYQKLYIDFEINTGDTPKKKPAKKKLKNEEGAAATAGSKGIEFSYKSKWDQDRHAEHTYSAKLRVDGLPELEDEKGEDKDIVFIMKAKKEYSREGHGTLEIRWDMLSKILSHLQSPVDPAHLLEVLRCAIFYGKSTRIVPDKWFLPIARPENGGTQVISNPFQLGRQKTEKVLPETKKDARGFLDEQITKLSEQLVQLCEKIETSVLPVYVNSVFIHAGLVKETSVRKHEIAVDVILVVQSEGQGNVKTSPEHKLIAPILSDFEDKGKVYKVYREYHRPLEYLPVLLFKKVLGITEEENKRLMNIYRPWFSNLSHWSNMRSKRDNEPWTPTRIVSHMLKCNLNIKIDLRTEAPPVIPPKVTRSQSDEKYFVHLWNVGTEKAGLGEIIRNEVEPVANLIIASFSEKA